MIPAAGPVTSGTLLDGSASSMSQEDIETALDALQRASNFTTYVGSGGSVDAGSTTLHLLVGNLEENTAACTFDLIVGGETLYYSPELIQDMDR